MQCTCAPHPRVDLAPAYAAGGGGDAAALARCRRHVRAACASHGCFHATVPLPAAQQPFDGAASLACLAGRRVGDAVESLFAPGLFLEGAVGRRSVGAAAKLDPSDTSDGDGCSDWETICNGGRREVPFPIECLPGDEHCAKDEDGARKPAVGATFRGRIAESGDEKQPVPEPKLSWEFRRCLGAGNALQQTTAGGGDIATANARCEGECDDTWRLLPDWTNALHSVAATIIYLLGIRPQLALQENRCQCLNRSSSESNECQKCNIDLLRVFRYDALPPSANGDPALGSSAHSDWGTLTVVWQDDEGGLQTHCRACDRWSDVEAGSDGCDSNTIHLFVHVGDFLSLASMGEGGDGVPAWPSPRHRVLCPTASQNDGQHADNCRRSLVYFAYPPPGVSLDAARRVVAPLACPTSANSGADRSVDSAAVYDCYSLLHDQSQQPTPMKKENGLDNTKGSASLQMHERIRGVAFDKVISDKWSQVQRKPT